MGGTRTGLRAPERRVSRVRPGAWLGIGSGRRRRCRQRVSCAHAHRLGRTQLPPQESAQGRQDAPGRQAPVDNRAGRSPSQAHGGPGKALPVQGPTGLHPTQGEPQGRGAWGPHQSSGYSRRVPISWGHPCSMVHPVYPAGHK